MDYSTELGQAALQIDDVAAWLRALGFNQVADQLDVACGTIAELRSETIPVASPAAPGAAA